MVALGKLRANFATGNKVNCLTIIDVAICQSCLARTTILAFQIEKFRLSNFKVKNVEKKSE